MASGVLVSSDTQKQQQDPVFHDFLGMNFLDSSVMLPASRQGVAGGLSEAFSGTDQLQAPSGSDMASLACVEKQVGSNFEGGQFDGLMGSFSVLDGYSGRKRSNSSSAFMGSAIGRVLPGTADAFENARLRRRVQQNDARGDRVILQQQEEFSNLMQPPRTVSVVSSLSQTPMSMKDIVASKLKDIVASKLERMTPSGTNTVSAMSFHPLLNQYNQYGSFTGKMASYGDNSIVPSIVTQLASDEGSRTGMKGSGNVTLVASASGTAGRSPKGTLSGCSQQKLGAHTNELDFLCPSSHRISPSVNRQMTIFYAGQAHVFDDVQPQKADAIMALAGSNGRSWSTTYSSKSSGAVVSRETMREIEVGGRKALSQDPQGTLPSTACTSIQGAQDSVFSSPGVVLTDTKGGQPEKDMKLPMLKDGFLVGEGCRIFEKKEGNDNIFCGGTGSHHPLLGELIGRHYSQYHELR